MFTWTSYAYSSVVRNAFGCKGGKLVLLFDNRLRKTTIRFNRIIDLESSQEYPSGIRVTQSSFPYKPLVIRHSLWRIWTEVLIPGGRTSTGVVFPRSHWVWWERALAISPSPFYNLTG